MPAKDRYRRMQEVFEGSKFKCLQYEAEPRRDAYSEYGEYDKRIRGRMFENPETNTISTVPTTGVPTNSAVHLTHFMDGSEVRLSLQRRDPSRRPVPPVLAGQVGVAVLQRGSDRSIKPMSKACSLRENARVSGHDQSNRSGCPAGRTREPQTAIHYCHISNWTERGRPERRLYKHRHQEDSRSDARPGIGRGQKDDGRPRPTGQCDACGRRQPPIQTGGAPRNQFSITQLATLSASASRFTPSQPVVGSRGSKHLGT